MKKSKKGQTYRHTPAFILLFLANQDLYGAALLTTMTNRLPAYKGDTAVIYRALQSLEEEGAITSYWETNTSGPARKWYKITDQGMIKLADFKKDIEIRKKNLEYFLDSYEKLNNPLSE